MMETNPHPDPAALPPAAADASATVHGLPRSPVAAGGAWRPGKGGSKFAAACLRWLGWRNDFPGLPAARGLVVVYPHTSNWDFPLGLLYKWANGLPLKFWIKDGPTKWPLVGAWIKWVGGVAINRRAAHGVVEDTMRQMRREDFFWLVVAPEGTRSLTSGWRTGFYHLWKAADCPLGLAYIDYGHKRIGMLDFVQCTGDMEADFAALARFYQDYHGYHPELQAPVRPFQRADKASASSEPEPPAAN